MPPTQGQGSRRRTRMAVAASAAAAAALAISASAGPASAAPAHRLKSQDPGARLGGATLVGTSGHDRIVGGSKADFIRALRGDDRVHGGAGHDEIGGGPGNDRLRGGPGPDYLLGGPGADTIAGGPGSDYIIDHRGPTVVSTGQGDYTVDVRDGHCDDRIKCRGLKGTVYADRHDTIRRNCRTGRGRVIYTKPPKAQKDHTYVSPAPNQSGSGTNDDPFTARLSSDQCNQTQADACGVWFNGRDLKGFWTNEYVPAYRCPASFPWLINRDVRSSDLALPRGVSGASDNTGVAITGYSGDVGKRIGPVAFRYATGTLTGFPYSSATSWTFNGGYQIGLYCTDDLKKAILLGGG
jgi:hypothetical protein